MREARAAFVPEAYIQKTLQLAEKYCIISKVAKAAMPVDVAIEEV